MRARAHAADVGRHVDHVVRARRQRAERGLGGVDEGGGIDRTGRADDDVAAAVVALHVLRQVVARQALDSRARADHRQRRRVRAPAGGVEQLVGRRHRVVLVLGQLLQQHLAFALEFVLRKARPQHQVGQHLRELARVLRQAAHVERGVVAVGVGVDVGAQAFGVEVDAARVARGRALEQHVLDHMADAVDELAFVRAAAADEDGDGGGGQRCARQRDHAHAVGQGVQQRLIVHSVR
jgi:hypothetical protein